MSSDLSREQLPVPRVEDAARLAAAVRVERIALHRLAPGHAIDTVLAALDLPTPRSGLDPADCAALDTTT